MEATITSSDAPQPPLLVVGDGGPLAFKTVDEVTSYMEAIDVLNGEYKFIFDSRGVEYTFMAENDSAPVVIGPPVDKPPKPEFVRRLVLDDMREWHKPPDVTQFEHLALPELLAFVAEQPPGLPSSAIDRLRRFARSFLR